MAKPISATARRRSGSAPAKTAPEVSIQRVQLAIQNRVNPIRGLTPDILSRALDQFKVGYLRDAALLWDAIEARDLNLKNVAGKAKKSVSRLPWEILTVEDAPETEAAAQRDVLVAFYNNLHATDVLNENERGGLRLLVKQMMDAKGKRFAVHEIVWQPGAKFTAELRFVPLWFFENRTGRLQFLPSEGAINGVPLEESGWLVTVGDGLMEASSVGYLYKSLPLKDWVSFSEKFGMPGVLGKTDAAKDSEEWNAMTEAVSSLVNDWAAVMSRSSEITLLETKAGGSNLPFEPLVEYMDRKIAALWRGADLSTISSGSAEGHGASVQGDETDLILEDDAAWIEETLNEQLTRFVLRYHFGPDVEPLAYLKLQIPDKKSLTDEINAYGIAVRAGVITPNLQDEIAFREKASLPPVSPEVEKAWKKNPTREPITIQDESSPAGGGFGGFGGARKPGQFANEDAVHVQRLAVAFADDLAPLRARLERILTIEDDDLMRAKLQTFLRDLPSLLKDINADPESARVLEDSLQRGLLAGAKGEQP